MANIHLTATGSITSGSVYLRSIVLTAGAGASSRATIKTGGVSGTIVLELAAQQGTSALSVGPISTTNPYVTLSGLGATLDVVTSDTNPDAPTVSEIADAVWMAPESSHVEPGSMGEYLAINVPTFTASGVWTSPTRSLTEFAALVDAIWDEALTGATHNVANSAGRRLRQLASITIWDGIAQGPGTGTNQIQLDTGASSVNGAYDPSLIYIVAGTGAGQSRLIYQYDGATRMATVDRDWKILPDNTSEFIIFGDAGREHVNEGLARGGTINTMILNANASSDDGAYVGQIVFLRSGAGADQVRSVSGYNGTTKTITVDRDFDVTPDTTTGYVMLPTQGAAALAAAAIWSYANRTLTSSGDVTIVSPVSIAGDALELVRSDDYALEDDRALSFTSSDWPDLTGATDITMTIRRRGEAFGDKKEQVLLTVKDTLASRVTGTGSQTVVFELTSALTSALQVGTSAGKFDIQATLATSGHIVTLVLGLVTVLEDQTR